MSIKVKGLSYTYQPGTSLARQALKNVSLTVAEGEFLGIMGASGSGKSTFLQHLNGSLPSKGCITVNGVALGGKGVGLMDIVSQVTMAFQYPEHQMFCDTVAEEIAFGCRNLGRSEAAIKRLVPEYLHKLGLDESYMLRSPFELSGGEKRRVALASVLAMDTPILLLDEPTVGLDAGGRQAVIKLIGQLNREAGKTIIWVGHDLRELAAVAQRLVVFAQGEIVLQGRTKDVLSRAEELSRWGVVLPRHGSVVQALADKFGPAYASDAGRRISRYLLGETEEESL